MAFPLPIYHGTLMSLDDHEARYMLAVGDAIRCEQSKLSQGDASWHHHLINSNGGPEEVMCSASLPANEYMVEIICTVAMAAWLGVHLFDMALIKLKPAPRGVEGYVTMPLCGCIVSERAIRCHARNITPIPEDVLEAVENLLHPDAVAKAIEQASRPEASASPPPLVLE